MPATLSQVTRMFRMNAVQTGILWVLAQKGAQGATISDITDQLALTFTTIHTHLRRLEADGLIATDQPPGPRQGRTVRYFSNPEAIREALDRLADHIAPE